MELTIKIADAEYKELSATQKRGLAELLQLDGAKGQDEAGEPEKPKKRRKKTDAPETTSTNGASSNDQRDGYEEKNPSEDKNNTTEEENPVEAPAETPVEESQPKAEPRTEEVKADVPTIEEIMMCGARFTTKNPDKIPELQEVFKEFGIQQITALKATPEKIPGFVEKLREIGVDFNAAN